MSVDYSCIRDGETYVAEQAYVVQLLSCAPFFATPWTPAHQALVLHYLPEFAQIHVHWVSDVIQSSHPLLPPSPFAFKEV